MPNPPFVQPPLEDDAVFIDDPIDSDWLKTNWRMPYYGTPEFTEALKSFDMPLAEFKRTFKFREAVRRGYIVADKWKGPTYTRLYECLATLDFSSGSGFPTQEMDVTLSVSTILLWLMESGVMELDKLTDNPPI